MDQAVHGGVGEKWTERKSEGEDDSQLAGEKGETQGPDHPLWLCWRPSDPLPEAGLRVTSPTRLCPQAQLGFASQPHFLLSRNPGVDGSRGGGGWVVSSAAVPAVCLPDRTSRTGCICISMIYSESRAPGKVGDLAGLGLGRQGIVTSRAVAPEWDAGDQNHLRPRQWGKKSQGAWGAPVGEPRIGLGEEETSVAG